MILFSVIFIQFLPFYFPGYNAIKSRSGNIEMVFWGTVSKPKHMLRVILTHTTKGKVNIPWGKYKCIIKDTSVHPTHTGAYYPRNKRWYAYNSWWDSCILTTTIAWVHHQFLPSSHNYLGAAQPYSESLQSDLSAPATKKNIWVPN